MLLRFPQVPTMVYLESMTDRETFISLNRRVKQVKLAEEMQKAICKEMQRVPHVNEVMTTISLVIRLTITMHIENDSMLLANFLHSMGVTNELWSRTVRLLVLLHLNEVGNKNCCQNVLQYTLTCQHRVACSSFTNRLIFYITSSGISKCHSMRFLV
jgi:hypothetical protein